jgi:hypothetical protein
MDSVEETNVFMRDSNGLLETAMAMSNIKNVTTLTFMEESKIKVQQLWES